MQPPDENPKNRKEGNIKPQRHLTKLHTLCTVCHEAFSPNAKHPRPLSLGPEPQNLAQNLCS